MLSRRYVRRRPVGEGGTRGTASARVGVSWWMRPLDPFRPVTGWLAQRSPSGVDEVFRRRTDRESRSGRMAGQPSGPSGVLSALVSLEPLAGLMLDPRDGLRPLVKPVDLRLRPVREQDAHAPSLSLLHQDRFENHFGLGRRHFRNMRRLLPDCQRENAPDPDPGGFLGYPEPARAGSNAEAAWGPGGRAGLSRSPEKKARQNVSWTLIH
jgi:hypothetical protein